MPASIFSVDEGGQGGDLSEMSLLEQRGSPYDGDRYSVLSKGTLDIERDTFLGTPHERGHFVNIPLQDLGSLGGGPSTIQGQRSVASMGHLRFSIPPDSSMGADALRTFMQNDPYAGGSTSVPITAGYHSARIPSTEAESGASFTSWVSGGVAR